MKVIRYPTSVRCRADHNRSFDYYLFCSLCKIRVKRSHTSFHCTEDKSSQSLLACIRGQGCHRSMVVLVVAEKFSVHLHIHGIDSCCWLLCVNCGGPLPIILLYFAYLVSSAFRLSSSQICGHPSSTPLHISKCSGLGTTRATATHSRRASCCRPHEARSHLNARSHTDTECGIRKPLHEHWTGLLPHFCDAAVLKTFPRVFRKFGLPQQQNFWVSGSCFEKGFQSD